MLRFFNRRDAEERRVYAEKYNLIALRDLQFSLEMTIVLSIRWLVNPSIKVVVGVRTMTTLD